MIGPTVSRRLETVNRTSEKERERRELGNRGREVGREGERGRRELGREGNMVRLHVCFIAFSQEEILISERLLLSVFLTFGVADDAFISFVV